MEKYILKYLQDTTQDEWRKKYYDYLKLHLDSMLWSFGSHVAAGNYERSVEHSENYVIPRKDTLTAIKGILGRAIDRKFFKQKRLQKQGDIQPKKAIQSTVKDSHKVFFAYHLPWLIPDETVRSLNNEGIEIDFISDSSKPWYSSVTRLLNWYRSIQLVPFNEIIKDKYVGELKELYNQVLEDFRKTDYEAVFVYSGVVFEEKIFIDIFRDLNRVSMEIPHGYLGYTSIVEIDRVDYYLLYGERVRELSIKAGFDPKKLCVAGGCKYTKSLDEISSLRNSLDDVLVLTSVTSFDEQYYWDYDQFTISDRSLLISYLYSIEKILKSNGVKHARLRPHPHVSKEWIMKYVDAEFYELDNQWNLEESLAKATCCIGQYTTVVFEAISQGVAYYVYEPGDGKYTMLKEKLFPPFDGSDPDLRIANSEEELDEMIKTHYSPAADLGRQYMEPFKPEVIREILEKEREKRK